MLTDPEIQQAVRQYLAERPDVQDGEVDVQVSKGVVTLRGKMSSELEKWQIEDAIRGMPGVDSLVNQTMFAAHSPSDAGNSDIARAWFP